jgi:hypothetical protein
VPWQEVGCQACTCKNHWTIAPRLRVTHAVMRLNRSIVALLVALLPGCESSKPDAAPRPPSSTRVSAAPAATSANAALAPAPSAAAPASANAPAAPAFGPFGETVQNLSERGGDFISDNLISNETSYLQTAKTLLDRPEGGVYIGVGPEQNFTYLALTRPKLAVIVDIRRDNLLQHLYYRYLFEEARDRSHFIALLVGRPYDEGTAPADNADFAAIAKHAEKMAPDPKLQKSIVDAAILRMTNEWGIRLDDKDKQSIKKMAQVFFDKQLDLRFELKETSGRKYPTLRELMATKDPAGAERSFLATNEGFRVVQKMEREGRVLPVIGDFAGDQAFLAIAEYLKKHDLKVTTFYVSNVEQYVLEPPVWKKYLRNVEALPRTDDAVFIRCYLDQGKKHPKQMEGHRTATVLAKMNTFLEREKKTPSRTFFAVATEGNLD